MSFCDHIYYLWTRDSRLRDTEPKNESRLDGWVAIKEYNGFGVVKSCYGYINYNKYPLANGFSGVVEHGVIIRCFA